MSDRMRLMIAALLFCGWIGWLAYLAVTATHPIVLSRPQLLVSTLDVIAAVGGDDQKPESTVTVQEVHWPPGNRNIPEKITITNLSRSEGWQGPGDYILPLVKNGDHYHVSGIPPSPGYPGSDQPRIYRANAETRHQLDAIKKPE
jgi:hypothetical protein